MLLGNGMGEFGIFPIMISYLRGEQNLQNWQCSHASRKYQTYLLCGSQDPLVAVSSKIRTLVHGGTSCFWLRLNLSLKCDLKQRHGLIQVMWRRIIVSVACYRIVSQSWVGKYLFLVQRLEIKWFCQFFGPIQSQLLSFIDTPILFHCVDQSWRPTS